MSEDSSLLDSPFTDWTYEAVNAFLEARIPEDERIEYKTTFEDTLQDTLVSFSNGSGGFIFVGVEEDAKYKKPAKWPRLSAAKEHLRTVFNKAGSETSPPVKPKARSFAAPETGEQVVVIRVEPGENPPYFAKNRGVRVRVGDDDVHADPRALELLFARRTSIDEVRALLRPAFLELNGAFVRQYGREYPVLTLHAYLKPAFGRIRFRWNESFTLSVRGLVRRYTAAISPVPQERRFDGGITYNLDKGHEIRIYRDGGIHYSRVLGDDPHPSVRQPARLVDIAPSIQAVLSLAQELYSSVFQYDGSIYTAVCLEDMENRLVVVQGTWPTEPTRSADPEFFGRWFEDEIPYRVGDDATQATRDLIKSLYWRAGYDNYEAIVETWGRGRSHVP